LTEFKGIKKILIIKLRHIGDVLLIIPAIRALKDTFPDASISVLVNAGTEDVLKGNPLIGELIVLDRGVKILPVIKRYAKEVSFLKTIRQKGFDMTVDLTGGDRAAIMSFASRAGYRLGRVFRKGFIGKKYMYTHLSAEPEGRKHTVLQNLGVVKGFGINTENLSVDFYIPEEDRLFIKKILTPDASRITYNAIVHVHPTSRWLFKCWKDEAMAEVIVWLLERGAAVIITSSPDIREVEKARTILSLVSSRITHHASRLIDLCGKTTIKQLGAISEASDLFFGVDSAPMHIAAAVGTPVIALFGPSGAFDWGPWDNAEGQGAGGRGQGNPYPKKNGIQRFGKHTVIQRDWDCIPCGEDGCEGSKISDCLDDIKPAEAVEIIERHLKRL